MSTIYLILFNLIFSVFTHPYYVSIWDVVLNTEAERVQLTCKVFLDDLESGLKNEFKQEAWNFESAQSDSLIGVYVNTKLNIRTSSGNVIPVTFLGKETEFDVTYLYFESSKVAEWNIVQEWFFTISFLTEVISDQMNVVHIVEKGKENPIKKSFMLHKNETEINLKLKAKNE